MGKTKIEWASDSWNPIRARNKLWERTSPGGKTFGQERIGWHCEHVSEGCRHCYAGTMNKRLGTGLEFKPGNRDAIELFLDEKMLLAPLHWRKPRMIFVCSMTDLFAEFVPDEWIDRMFGVMALCPRHTFQVLTKRPERMLAWYEKTRDRTAPVECLAELYIGVGTRGWPLPNVWLGTSCEDQEAADTRIPDLLTTPTAVHWMSYEPALGPLKLHETLGDDWLASGKSGERRGLDWVVCGGESGHGARPMDIAWVRSILAQCKAAGVPCFVKQLGARPFSLVKDKVFNIWAIGKGSFEAGPFSAALKSAKGGDWAEWTSDLRVQEIPQ